MERQRRCGVLLYLFLFIVLSVRAAENTVTSEGNLKAKTCVTKTGKKLGFIDNSWCKKNCITDQPDANCEGWCSCSVDKEQSDSPASLTTWTRLKTGTYYLATEAVTWFEARDLCNLLGSHLAKIESQEEQETIATHLKTSRNLGSKSFWIGLNDLKKKGEWVWDTSGPAQYFNWYGGSPPSTRHPKGKECVWIIKARGTPFDLQWTNEYCSWKLNPLCEKGSLLTTSVPATTSDNLPPEMPLVPNEILKAGLGVSIGLDCRVENGSSDSLTWRKGEVELESRLGLLFIPKLARDQAGTYICTDDKKLVIKSVRLEVSGSDQTPMIVGLVAGITVLILGGLVVGCYCRHKKTTTSVPERGTIEKNEIYGLYHRGFDGEGDYGDGDVVEIVDNKTEYGHVEEGDVGEIVDNNSTYGH